MKGAKAEKTEKTNVMRLLDAAGIPYRSKEYEVDESDLSGVHAAEMLGQDPDSVFKTLVLKGEKTGYLVCCIPVAEEVDLKKAARAAGDKKVEMIPMKELLPVTGYIRGGCSPIGMKKKFPTYIEETAMLFDEIAVSAGMRGVQILLDPEDLKAYVQAEYADLTKDG
ncbi:MAG TPA: Cys-tRNA(Pro) deacylase [Candidatus Ventrimonas merdavium]|nr:Cys-tRNA(Pro) deacylase [Candidatus Ventrimonas merdavium]